MADSTRPKNVLVIGANRGIGLQLIKEFQSRGFKTHGTVRPHTINDPSVSDLESTGAQILHIDYTDHTGIAVAAQRFGANTPLDVLVNCGGISPGPVDGWEHSPEQVSEAFQVMALGPYVATRTFKANLELAATRSGCARVLNISSDWASIAQTEGDYLSYRVAKAALNMTTKTLAENCKRDNVNIAFLAVNPGYVATKLTNYAKDASDDVVVSCKGMTDLCLRLGMEETGTFWNYDGTPLPW